jgi:uncharacterized protein YneF (UPF0154 family)
MAGHGFVILVILIGLSGLFAAYYRAQRYMRSEDKNHPVWDYVLLWPLLFNKTSVNPPTPRRNRLLTTREIVGWVVVVLLIVVAIIFGWWVEHAEQAPILLEYALAYLFKLPCGLRGHNQ